MKVKINIEVGEYFRGYGLTVHGHINGSLNGVDLSQVTICMDYSTKIITINRQQFENVFNNRGLTIDTIGKVYTNLKTFVQSQVKEETPKNHEFYVNNDESVLIFNVILLR